MADTFARMRSIIGTTAEWASNDLVLGDGEIAVERAGAGIKIKVGDGGSKFSQSPYLSGDAGAGIYLPLTGGTMSGPISLPAAAGIGNQAISRSTGDALYVKGTQLTTVGGAPSAGKVVQLDSNGLLNTSMINVPGNIIIKAAVAPTDPAPTSVATGDAYVFSTDGTLDNTWAPIGGTVVKAGDMVIYIQPNWSVLATSSDVSNAVAKTGDTMTGPLILSGNPTLPLGAATKQYTDGFLPLTGGTLTGPLALPAAAPTAANQATNKSYVDGKFLPLTGGTLTGILSMSGTGINFISNAGVWRSINFSSNTVDKYRWSIFTDGTAESGGNAGSDFGIIRFNDAGTTIDTPFKIVRSSGEMQTVGLNSTNYINAVSNLGIGPVGARMTNWKVTKEGTVVRQYFNDDVTHRFDYDISTGNFTLAVYSGSYVFGNDGNTASKNVAGQWSATSDVRIKERIEDYTPGLNAVLALRPRTFSFKAEASQNTAKRYVGMVAQEAKAAMPDTVTVGPGKMGDIELQDMHTFDPTNITYALVNAVKELAAQVKALQEAK